MVSHSTKRFTPLCFRKFTYIFSFQKLYKIRRYTQRQISNFNQTKHKSITPKLHERGQLFARTCYKRQTHET
ncbi:hypothetical protein HanIR_Chr10g0482261 [Helianthus annuus]|nr:hypothetical protein HanIR_Chr10g0482261 [Helianthus annuus]